MSTPAARIPDSRRGAADEPSRAPIKGVICGVRVEDIEGPTMREIRYVDKLIDDLARGKKREKLLRKPEREPPCASSRTRRR